jgi:hypothetical protein
MSKNDTMIEDLSIHLDDFAGASSQTRCFLHILNITTKAIIQQFDVPKAKKGVVMISCSYDLDTHLLIFIHPTCLPLSLLPNHQDYCYLSSCSVSSYLSLKAVLAFVLFSSTHSLRLFFVP